jgi:uncharacterized DUF497 family protein
MDIGYVWDEAKYALVQEKHGVPFAEVVDVMESLEAMHDHDPQDNPGRYMAVGETKVGRLLQVIYTDEDWPLYRIVTAFPASKEWEDEFRQ